LQSSKAPVVNPTLMGSVSLPETTEYAGEQLSDRFAAKLDYPTGGSDGDLLAKDGTAAEWIAPSVAGLTLITAETFSAVSSVNINNCFSATYTNYRFVARINYSSTAVGLNMRFRASGTDNTVSYNRQFISASSSTLNSGASFNQSEFLLMNISSNDVGFASGDIFGPNLARRTPFYSVGGYDNIAIQYLGEHDVTSAFDGLTIFVPSGTITGTLSIYGYKD